jgi:hypothetical protein
VDQRSHTHTCTSCAFDWDHDDPDCDFGPYCDCEDCLVEQVYWEEETITTLGFCPPEDPDREPNHMELKLLRIGGFKSVREMDEHYGALAASVAQRDGVSENPNADRMKPPGGTEARLWETPRSTEGATAAVEFSVDLKEFNQAAKHLFAGKSGTRQARFDFVDLNAVASQIKMVIPGASSALTTEIKTSGYARVPLTVFERICSALHKLPDDLIEVSIRTGSMKIGALTFSHPEISLRLIGARIADLPIDAPLPDVLASLVRFSPDEIEDSGLLARVLAANEEAWRLIDEAFKNLEPLGIERAALSRFVSEQIELRAQGGK